MPKNKDKKKKSTELSSDDDEDFLTAGSVSEKDDLDDIPLSPVSTSSYHTVNDTVPPEADSLLEDDELRTPVSPVSIDSSDTYYTAEENLLPAEPLNTLKKLGNQLQAKLSSINQSTAYKPMPKEESDDHKPKSPKKLTHSDTMPEEDDESITGSTKLLKKVPPEKSSNKLASGSLSDKLKNLLPKSKYEPIPEDPEEPDIQDPPSKDNFTSIKAKVKALHANSLDKEDTSNLAEQDEEHIKCYILDKPPKSSWLPSISKPTKQLLGEQIKLFITFLENAAAKYQDPKELAIIEANNFSPADLKALITKLNKKTPRILVKLQLPENLDQCSYLIKTNTNQTETKNMTQQEYDKATKLINKYNSEIEKQITKITSSKPKI